jgi:hypothetical protein
MVCKLTSVNFTQLCLRGSACAFAFCLAISVSSAQPRADASAPPQNSDTPCTPLGLMESDGPPLLVEVRDEFGPYRADQVTMLSDSSGWPLITLACHGPRDIFRRPPGTYRVMAFVGDVRSQEITINVPPEGTEVTLMLEPAPGRLVNSPALD